MSRGSNRRTSTATPFVIMTITSNAVTLIDFTSAARFPSIYIRTACRSCGSGTSISITGSELFHGSRCASKDSERLDIGSERRDAAKPQRPDREMSGAEASAEMSH
jgi:hypothetical protein